MQKCCETPILPGTYEKGSITTFSGTNLGECDSASINMLEPVEATVIMPSSTNGWGGTSINIYSSSGHYVNCPVTLWIDTDEVKREFSSNFKIDCSIKGRAF